MKKLLDILIEIYNKKENIEEIENLDKLYNYCVEHGYSSTRENFEDEYKGILEQSINNLSKSELSDNALDLVSGGIDTSKKFKSSIALVLASVSALSSPAGAVSSSININISNNINMFAEKMSNYTQVGKEYLNKGWDTFKSGAKSFAKHGKEALNTGIGYASEYGKNFMEHGKNIAKTTGALIKANPVASAGIIGSSILGTGVVGGGTIYLIDKAVSSSKKDNSKNVLDNKNSNFIDSINNSNNLNKTHYPITTKFLESITPKNGKAPNFKGLSESDLVAMYTHELGGNDSVKLENTKDIKAHILAVYVRVYSLMNSKSAESLEFKELEIIRGRVIELAKVYHVDLNKTTDIPKDKELSESLHESATEPKEINLNNINLNNINFAEAKKGLKSVEETEDEETIEKQIKNIEEGLRKQIVEDKRTDLNNNMEEQLRILEKHESEINDMNNEINEKENVVSDLNNDIEKLNNDIKNLENQNEEFDSRVRTNIKEITHITKNIAKIHQRIQQLNSDINSCNFKDRTKIYDEIRSNNSKIEENNNQKLVFGNENETLNKNIYNNKNTVNELKNSLDKKNKEYNKKLEELKIATEKRDKQLKNIEDTNTKINSIKKEIEEVIDGTYEKSREYNEKFKNRYASVKWTDKQREFLYLDGMKKKVEENKYFIDSNKSDDDDTEWSED